MSNIYFNHTNRFVPGTVARAEDVNSVFDGVTSGFQSVQNNVFASGEFPDQLGNAGKSIVTDGTNVFWSDLDAGTF